ncbi:hypothetical protein [Rhizobium sp. 007]|uniref:hypothetical protein n=1 Tax=Rhizobium sp. 007 TaxID=2785056 RepID=UPI00188F15C7|nr:hypothetical protein [Rhizobium sp. 007]QPB24650.1 hypothetical protein ISN39_34680 [Rhizobium sp. 007]
MTSAKTAVGPSGAFQGSTVLGVFILAALPRGLEIAKHIPQARVIRVLSDEW